MRFFEEISDNEYQKEQNNKFSFGGTSINKFFTLDNNLKFIDKKNKKLIENSIDVYKADLILNNNISIKYKLPCKKSALNKNVVKRDTTHLSYGSVLHYAILQYDNFINIKLVKDENNTWHDCFNKNLYTHNQLNHIKNIYNMYLNSVDEELRSYLGDGVTLIENGMIYKFNVENSKNENVVGSVRIKADKYVKNNNNISILDFKTTNGKNLDVVIAKARSQMYFYFLMLLRHYNYDIENFKCCVLLYNKNYNKFELVKDVVNIVVTDDVCYQVEFLLKKFTEDWENDDLIIKLLSLYNSESENE